jgi:hypothetical protein
MSSHLSSSDRVLPLPFTSLVGILLQLWTEILTCPATVCNIWWHQNMSTQPPALVSRCSCSEKLQAINCVDCFLIHTITKAVMPLKSPCIGTSFVCNILSEPSSKSYVSLSLKVIHIPTSKFSSTLPLSVIYYACQSNGNWTMSLSVEGIYILTRMLQHLWSNLSATSLHSHSSWNCLKLQNIMKQNNL